MTEPNDIQRAINELESYSFGLFGNVYISPDTKDDAITALREKLQWDYPVALTMEELRERDGKPVFAVDGENHKCWVIVNAKDECCADNEFGSWQMCFYNMTNVGSDTLHDMGWLAYDHPPKEAKEDKPI